MWLIKVLPFYLLSQSSFKMIAFITYYLDLLIDKIFGLYFKPFEKKIPEPRNNLVQQSATTLARKIRRREVKSEEIVRAFIERIKEVNPILNAVVDERFDEAIKEAQNVDREIEAGRISDEDFQKKPFLGVPMTIKEVIAVEGLSHTFGLISRKSQKAAFDADGVQKLKRSGVIILGNTNIPQLSSWIESTNPIYGRTNNPYNTARTAGGSSGGEASIIAACGSPMGLGTELGGSVRLPASHCGLFGHKVTNGLISTHGVMFNTYQERNSLGLLGPLTRYSEDLIPTLKVLLGENVNKLKLDETVDLKDIKMYYVIDPEDATITPFRDEIKETLLKAVKHFSETLPDKPKLLKIEELKYGGKVWFSTLDQEPNITFEYNLTNRQYEVNRISEIIKFFFGSSHFNLGVICFLLAPLIFPKIDNTWANGIKKNLLEKLTATLGTNGVLLYPSAPLAATYHRAATLRVNNTNLYSVWNALGFCATQVPMGLNHEGLPVGIQVVAAPFQDHLTLAVAKELERVFGGYVPPFKLDEFKQT